MRIVFDLDGTLSDPTHRLHYIKGERKDWDSFFRESYKDEPIHVTLHILQDLHAQGHSISIWSGRSKGDLNEVRNGTLGWLEKQNIAVRGEFQRNCFITIDALLMREHGDHRPDVQLKLEWLAASRTLGCLPDLVFEDRGRMVVAWREAGIPCFQVADGAF